MRGERPAFGRKSPWLQPRADLVVCRRQLLKAAAHPHPEHFRRSRRRERSEARDVQLERGSLHRRTQRVDHRRGPRIRDLAEKPDSQVKVLSGDPAHAVRRA